jgi:phosphate transport system permease protein
MTASIAPPAPVSRALVRTARDRRRSIVDRTFRGLSLGAAILGIIPLFAIIAYVTINGIQALNLDLLTKAPKALGVGGGAAGAILGSIQMVGLATIMAVPLGILAGVYVNEFGSRRSARAIRFAADVMVGVPSILIGIFVFTILVLPFKQFNAFAGSVSLAVIMIPVIMRTTEEILKIVPGTLREASLSLGVPVWRTVLSVVIPTGLAGILTGLMLAVARAAGETAPLLFTAAVANGTTLNLGDKMNSLPVQIFTDVGQAQDRLVARAWGAALTLVLLVLVLTLIARLFARRSRLA